MEFRKNCYPLYFVYTDACYRILKKKEYMISKNQVVTKSIVLKNANISKTLYRILMKTDKLLVKTLF